MSFELNLGNSASESLNQNISENLKLAQKVLSVLVSEGVQDILLCAGARNSPFVAILEKSHGIRFWNFFDERAAGFFALGRAQRDQRPLAVITTSGTAVAELLPAAVEATYSGTPIIFVTADRPRQYRGTGAPQAIEQVGIFSKYVEICKDLAHWDENLDLSTWTRNAPVQINVCFKEPLLEGEIPSIDFQKFKLRPQLEFLTLEQAKIVEQPLIIAGALTVQQAEKLAPCLEKWGAPIYAEALSNLKKFPGLQKLLINSGEQTVRQIFENGFCKSVLRIGGVPTLRFWRDLEGIFRKIPVFSISDLQYTGLSRPVQHTLGLKNISVIKSQWTEDFRPQVFSLDRERRERLRALLEKYPQSEPSLLYQLGPHLANQFVYLGNSSPIREWDLVHSFSAASHRTGGNRGANGIDGQVSSFLGGCQTECENWAVVGDLTALYDLSALWVTKQMTEMKLRLVVINNKGGMIFKNMFSSKTFLNEHEVEFSHWAKMWNWNYEKWEKTPDPAYLSQLAQVSPHLIIELTPDPRQSEDFWAEIKTFDRALSTL